MNSDLGGGESQGGGHSPEEERRWVTDSQNSWEIAPAIPMHPTKKGSLSPWSLLTPCLLQKDGCFPQNSSPRELSGVLSVCFVFVCVYLFMSDIFALKIYFPPSPSPPFSSLGSGGGRFLEIKGKSSEEIITGLRLCEYRFLISLSGAKKVLLPLLAIVSQEVEAESHAQGWLI